MDDQELAARIAELAGSVAAVVGVVAALIRSAPEPARAELVPKIVDELEGMHAMLLASAAPRSESALRGFQSVRDLLVERAREGPPDGPLAPG